MTNADRFQFRAWDGEKMVYNFIVARPQICDLLGIMTDEEFAVETFNSITEWKVMQCTGLKDNSGVLIYEGDIITVYGGETHSGYREVSLTG